MTYRKFDRIMGFESSDESSDELPYKYTKKFETTFLSILISYDYKSISGLSIAETLFTTDYGLVFDISFVEPRQKTPNTITITSDFNELYITITERYSFLKEQIDDEINDVILRNNREEININFKIKSKKIDYKSLQPQEVLEYFKILGAKNDDVSKIIPYFLNGEVLEMCTKEELIQDFEIPRGLAMLHEKYKNKYFTSKN